MRRYLLIAMLVPLLFVSCLHERGEIVRYQSETFTAYAWIEERDLAVIITDPSLIVPSVRVVELNETLLAEVSETLLQLRRATEQADPVSALVANKRLLRKSPLVDTLALLCEDPSFGRRLAKLSSTTFLDLRGMKFENDIFELYLHDVRAYQMRRSTTK